MGNVNKPGEKCRVETKPVRHQPPVLNQAASPEEPPEVLLQTLCDSSPIGVYIVRDKKLQYVNPKYQELTGFSEGELLDIDPFQLVLPIDKDSAKASAIAMLKGKRTQPYEYRVFNKDGGIRHIMETVTSIQHQGRRAVLGNYMDITEQVKMGEALRDSEQQYHSLFKSMLNGFAYCQIVVDKNNQPIDFIYLEVNDAFERLTGLRKEDVIGKKATEALPGIKESHSDLFDTYGKVALTGEPTDFELYFEPLAIWLTISVYCPRRGYFVAVFDNITERKQAEEALWERKENFRALAEDSSDGISISNYEGEIGKRVYCNQGLAKLTGYSVEEILSLPLMEIVHPDDRARLTEIRRKRVGQDSAPKRYESTLMTREGDTLPVELIISKTVWQGQPAIMVVYRDVTERKRAEEALRESEEKYRSIFDKAPVSIILTDKDGQIIDVNPYHIAEIGKGKTTSKDYIGKNLITLPPVVSAGLSDEYRRLVSKGEPLNLEGMYFPITTGGVQRYMNVRGIPLVIDDKVNGAMFIHEDITERKQAEEALRESEERYRDLFENANDLIQSVAPDGHFIYVNKTWRRTLGYSEKEIGNLTIWDIIHPDSIDHCREVFKSVFSGVTSESLEAVFVTRDGKAVPVEGHANCRLEDGKPVATRGIFRDITERKQAEQAREEVDSLKSEFVSNVTHELRSPLHSIKGFTELMLEGKVPDLAIQKEFLSIIDEQSQHLSSLIDNLLDISRLEAGRFSIEKGLTSVQDIIHAAVGSFYGLSTEKGVPITEVIPSTLPDIEADARRIKQVMFNLLSNAIKFSDPGSPVTVKAEAKDGQLLIRVIDRGPGISKEALPLLFSRFHQEGYASRIGGTGLGLHISKQIIEAHGGRIWTKSRLGQGSTFIFTLPLGHKGGDHDE